MNRSAHALVVLAACQLAALMATPRAASACSCIGLDSASQAYGEADAVFAATATRSEYPFGTYFHGVHLEVDTVWKGEVERDAIMVTGEYDAASGMSTWNNCEQLPGLNERTLVFATRKDGFLTSGTCSGTAAWTEDGAPALLADLVREFGVGTPPEPAPEPGIPIDVPLPTASADAERARPTPQDGTPPRWVLPALGAVAVLVVLLAARRPLRRALRDGNDV